MLAGVRLHGDANMIDLEQEFEKLMRIVRKQIEDKQASGELTTEEAYQLQTMVNVRLYPTTDEALDNDGWSSSKCW